MTYNREAHAKAHRAHIEARNALDHPPEIHHPAIIDHDRGIADYYDRRMAEQKAEPQRRAADVDPLDTDDGAFSRMLDADDLRHPWRVAEDRDRRAAAEDFGEGESATPEPTGPATTDRSTPPERGKPSAAARRLLVAIRDSEYHDGHDVIDNPVWVDMVCRPFGKSAGGLMAALVALGLAGTDGETCWITAAGFEVAR